ncbi:MAG: ABC transporter permease subunit/CPBP intramembrane protease [Pirellulaceae bacterium]|nr:ABC transporter permease subunit/CPBP intramembrane protease [Pirellulaceae bacterium]
MNWSRIRLIFVREMRDQVRDRRTMFTIFVLPLLLYPFMGMLMLQVAQFHSEQTVRITWIGEENWPTEHPLLNSQDLKDKDSLVHWNKLAYKPDDSSPPSNWNELGFQWVKSGDADLVFIVPPEFTESWKSTGQAGLLKTIVNQASDRSVIASQRLHAKLDSWQRGWLRDKLSSSDLNPAIIDPIQTFQIDVAPQETKQALIWSKLLPLVMLVWALTGAFYPAIDLCAGEKERGTLETLLSSPATRREIVWGKLFTVMSFSVGTAILNLFSMQLTSSFVINQFARMGANETVAALGPLPLSALTWLIVILLPIAAMFSALALAVAALARSSKEGQYYLMPLLLAGLPLVLLPMIPGITLSIGNSAIPVTGAVLLARALIEGQYRESLIHAPIVIAVTVICCLLAVRWAVRQFESESVMFRESERFQWSLWFRQIWRDRAATATANEALLCGVIILVALFFGRMSFTSSQLDWPSITRSTIAIQLGMILAPCLIMATFMTASIRRALRIEAVRPHDFGFALVLGLTLHPAYMLLSSAIQHEFQFGAETRELFVYVDSLISAAPLWSVILTLAVIPAICEELAFRGFIFGGLIRQNGILRAILVSSLFFGLSHGVLQQSIGATIMGLILGVIAWRTGGVVCGIVLHMTHNSLTMIVSRAGKTPDSIPGELGWILQQTTEGIAYTDAWLAVSIFVSAMTLVWFCLRSSKVCEGQGDVMPTTDQNAKTWWSLFRMSRV